MANRKPNAGIPDPSETSDAADAAVEARRDAVAERYEIHVTDEVADLLERLEQERDEAVAARQRALADYANFERRSRENETRAEIWGATRVVRSMLDVADQFDLILEQDASTMTVEQLLGGVHLVRQALGKAFDQQSVSRIEPTLGEAFDPNRHEAMMRQPADGVPANHIVSVLQPGYALGDTVLRAAKVAVAPEDD